MRRKCLVCSKETGIWEAGEPHFISHGVCEGFCEKVLEAWTMSSTSQLTLQELYQRMKEKEHDR